MIQYFPQLYECSCRNIKVELDISKYATKANLKGAAGVNTSNLARQSDLTSSKPEVDKKDLDKLKTITADLSKLSNIVDNDAVKQLCMIKWL